MVLFINTANNKKTIVKVGEIEVIEEYSQPSQQEILQVINKALIKKGLTINQISQININIGPGSYTSLRVGCAVANTLAWGLGIEVNGKKLVEPKYE